MKSNKFYKIVLILLLVQQLICLKALQLMKLNKGAIIELDRKVGEAIDIYVNNSLVARGEVVVVDDKLGITMTEIVKAPNK